MTHLKAAHKEGELSLNIAGILSKKNSGSFIELQSQKERESQTKKEIYSFH